MKSLLLVVTVFASLSAFASGPFSGYDYSKFCKGQVTSKDGYSLNCTKTKNAAEVLKATNTKKQDQLTVQPFSAIEDFGVMPDPDTNNIYLFSNELKNSEGKTVGYLVISGYQNSEMDYKMQLTQRLNLQGELVQAKIVD